MTTRPPAGVQKYPDDSTEKIASACVAAIPVREPNDRERLAHHVWRHLKGSIPTLEEALSSAQARILIPEEEALVEIRARIRTLENRTA